MLIIHILSIHTKIKKVYLNEKDYKKFSGKKKKLNLVFEIIQDPKSYTYERNYKF